MSEAEDFNRLYRDISNNISVALADIGDLEVENEEGKQKLSKMTEKLQSIQEKFQGELEFLEEHAEWDQFTVAFFGETNSGKSTILESLRILFREESRQKLLEENQNNLESFEEAVRQHAEKVRTRIADVMAEHASDVSELRQESAQLAEVLKEERAERIRIVKSEASARVKKKMAATAALAMVIGAGVAGPVGALVGG